ncbi:MAG: hypothetical protein HFG49_03030 [Lachnospiraceae bacterium]|jgi:hypothetical protein|nr:hypothetical protein [Lachnospiraceae bacterium]
MERIIELSKLDEEGVVIEKSDEFETSAFSAVYRKTKLLLNEMITGKDRKKTLQGDINNIISFEGRRGTGKTSVMLSVHKALENYEKNSVWDLDESDGNVSFVTLNYIDASLLENEESIIELILANMFSKLLEYDRNGGFQNQNEYGSKEVYRLFEKVFSSFTALNSQTGKYREISPLRVLNELSSSQLLGENIKELVDQYLEYMDRSRGDRRRKNRFLVISVDDIDMNLNTGKGRSESVYEVLENLHRYFMIPNVILMLTYDYSDLCIGCEKHFYQIYPKKWEPKTEVNRQYVRTITVEYLKKVVPIYSRVYMPSLRKKDYSDDNITKIRMNIEEIQRDLKPFKAALCRSRKNETVDLTVKKFSFLMKASVSDLYYDALGGKKHFAEPTSLREMVQSYRFYRYLLNLLENGQSEEDRDPIVFKELLDDLYFRFATERLNRNELTVFKRYLDVTIERRSQDILSDLEEIFNEKQKGKNPLEAASDFDDTSLSSITCIGDKKSSYSYGELLFGLYQASKNGWFSKEFIWCILNSYTIMLTKLYRKMQKTNNQSEEKKLRNKFAQIIGASVSSSWSNLFVPKLQRVHAADLEEEMDEANENQIILDAQNTSLVSVGSIRHSLSYVKIPFKLEKYVTLSEFIKELRMIEIMGMFFTRVSHRGSQVALNHGFKITYNSFIKNKENSTDHGSNNRNEQRVDINFEYTDGCFNIMNFVTNLFLWDSYFDSLHANLKGAFEEYYRDIRRLGNQEIRIKKIDGFFETYSLKACYKSWNHEFKGFAMPLYSFDMMYNIMKRCYQHRGLFPVAVGIDHFWHYVKRVYVSMGNLLRAEGAFYFSDGEKGLEADSFNRFWRAYEECPFIDYINKLDENSRLRTLFLDNFKQMILSCCGPEEIKK